MALKISDQLLDPLRLHLHTDLIHNHSRGHVHFSKTSKETISDKIKRMLKNEIQQM